MPCPVITNAGRVCSAASSTGNVCGRHKNSAYWSFDPRFRQAMVDYWNTWQAFKAEECRLESFGIDLLEIQASWKQPSGNVVLGQERTREFPTHFLRAGNLLEQMTEMEKNLAQAYGSAGSNACALARHWEEGLPRLYSPVNPIRAMITP